MLADWGTLLPLEISEVSTAAGTSPRALFENLLHRHHYLSYRSPVGENLQYLASDRQGRPLACMLFGAAAWQCGARDEYIGWDAATRGQGLPLIANNSRFLIAPWVRVPSLASHLLSRIARRLSCDWQRKYGHPIYLLETFVQRDRFAGRCYRATTRLGLEALTAQLYREALQRGLSQARQVLVVADGAVWIWNLAKDRFPDAR